MGAPVEGRLLIEAAEFALIDFVKHFLREPYRHRVEHSLHVDLYNVLTATQPISQGRITFQGDEAECLETGLVHKEWPAPWIRGRRNEPHGSRRKPGEKRGNFDLAVLEVPREPVSLACFGVGDLNALVAMELGLNYGPGHLKGDLEKLQEYDTIPCRYLVHLRQPHRHASGPHVKSLRTFVDGCTGVSLVSAVPDSRGNYEISIARGGCGKMYPKSTFLAKEAEVLLSCR